MCILQIYRFNFFKFLLHCKIKFFFQDGSKLSAVSEAEVRAAFTARLGAPLTGQMLSRTLPYYPTLPSNYVLLNLS